MKKYGSLISKLRKEHGFTQEQLGKELNVSYQAVSKWENNMSEPDLETIEKLTVLFGITMSDFFDMSNGTKTPIRASDKRNDIDNKGNFIKNKPWYLVAGMGVLILILALCAFLIPVKLSSQQVFNKYESSVFYISARDPHSPKSGTGFFINNSGLAITTYSNLEDCKQGIAKLSNGKEYFIKTIVGVDEENDIAIIQVDIKKSNPVKIGNSNKLKLGDKVFSITYSANDTIDEAKSVITEGIVFKVESSSDGAKSIQTTASIDDANKGGIILNEYGEVVGIIMDNLRVSGVSFDMVNVCCPINKIKNIERTLNKTMEDYIEMHKTLLFYSDGAVISTRDFISGEKIEPITDPTKIGYTFGGWYTSSNFETVIDFNNPIINQTECYAKWIPIIYTIRFDSNGAEGMMNDLVIEYDTEVPLPNATFVFPHYKMTGWKIENENIIFSQNQLIKNLTEINNDVIVLKALWEVNKYIIHFDGNLADCGEMDDLTLNYFDTLNLPLLEFQRTGYLFGGWLCNDIIYQDNQEISKLCDEDGGVLDFIAQWNPITYHIRFNSNNNKGETKIQTFVYDQPELLDECLFEFTAENKVFYKWVYEYYDENYGRELWDWFNDKESVLNLTTVNEDVLEFDAYWTDFYYIVNFDVNGGTADVRTVNIEYNDSAMLSNYFDAPQKTGYYFAGWEWNGGVYHHGTYIEIDYEIGAKPIELLFKARWVANSYTVGFYYDVDAYRDREDYLYTQTLTYDKPEKLMANQIDNPGRKIAYWQQILKWEMAAGRVNLTYGKQYADEAEVLNLVSSGFTVLCAVWESVEFNIAYHNLDGKDGTKIVQASYSLTGDVTNNGVYSTASLKNHVFAGFIFNGVLYEPNEKIYYLKDLNAQEGGTYHIYAQWDEMPKCEIKFYANGGEGEMESVWVYYDDNFIFPECLFTREGYEFLFWSINRECDINNTQYQDFNRYNVKEIIYAINDIKKTESITLWANWKLIEE